MLSRLMLSIFFKFNSGKPFILCFAYGFKITNSLVDKRIFFSVLFANIWFDSGCNFLLNAILICTNPITYNVKSFILTTVSKFHLQFIKIMQLQMGNSTDHQCKYIHSQSATPHVSYSLSS